MKKIYIPLIVALFCSQIYSFVRKVESLVHCNEDTDTPMPGKLYLFDDLHCGHEDVHPQQRNDMLHFIRQTGSSFIAESHEPKNKKLTIRELRKQARYLRHPFFYLSRLTAYSGTLTTNVDFRSYDRTLEALKKITDPQIQKVLTYNGPPWLTKYAQEVIDRHNNCVAPACRFLHNNLDKVNTPEVQTTVQSLLDLYDPSVKVKNIDSISELVHEAAVCYNLEFVDLEILHALVEHGQQKAPSTVIYAGGAHLRNIKPILSKLGYRLVSLVTLLHENDTLSNLCEALHAIEPDYDPEAKLPKNMVDYLLTYIEFEHEHPHWVLAIPATIVATVIGVACYLITSAMASDNAQ